MFFLVCSVNLGLTVFLGAASCCCGNDNCGCPPANFSSIDANQNVRSAFSRPLCLTLSATSFRSLSCLPPVDPELLRPVEGSSRVALSRWLAISIVPLSFRCLSFPSTCPPQGEYSSRILCDLLSSFFRLTFLIWLEGPDVGDFLRLHMLVHLTIKRTVYFSNTNSLLQSRSNNLIQMVFAFMQYLKTFLEEQSQQ